MEDISGFWILDFRVWIFITWDLQFSIVDFMIVDLGF